MLGIECLELSLDGGEDPAILIRQVRQLTEAGHPRRLGPARITGRWRQLSQPDLERLGE